MQRYRESCRINITYESTAVDDHSTIRYGSEEETGIKIRLCQDILRGSTGTSLRLMSGLSLLIVANSENSCLMDHQEISRCSWRSQSPSGLTMTATKLLAQPGMPTVIMGHIHCLMLFYPSAVDGPSSPLASLSVEVLHMIFSHLTDYPDIFSLSVVNPYFWEIGRQHLKQSIVSVLCPLGDTALICVGDYTSKDPPDYPANLLTEDEEKELQAGLNSDERYDDDEDHEERPFEPFGPPMNLYELAEARYGEFVALEGRSWFWPKIEYHFRMLGKEMISLRRIAEGSLQQFPESKRSRILALASPSLKDFFPKKEVWVLRNLTTREFVRGDAIALREDLVGGPLIEGLGFGEVVLSRICFSSYNASMSYEGEIHRGVWSGHRFDITTLRKLQMEKNDKESGQWNDVSEEVAKEIAAIWTSEWGNDWVNVLIRKRIRE